MSQIKVLGFRKAKYLYTPENSFALFESANFREQVKRP
jgi:hypothetical protein